jgi:hypothetical protein
MSQESVERQIRSVLDEAVSRVDIPLPRRLVIRISRLLRELPESERISVVETIAADPRARQVLDDVYAALGKSFEAAQVSARSRPKDTRGPRFRDRKDRSLRSVPYGIRVTYQGVSAIVRPPYLVLDDGQQFLTPSPAAKYVNGDVEANGWEVWKISDGRSLAECYDSGNWPPA